MSDKNISINPLVITAENARQELSLSTVTIDTLQKKINELPWFLNLGKPSKWDKGCVRIHDWNEWPGPEDNRVNNLAEHIQAIYNWLGVDKNEHLKKLFTQTRDKVLAIAPKNVPEYKPEEDAWHGPTQCVWDAAYCAGIVACSFDLGKPIHDDIQELWAWFEAGHWPCGFANDPHSVPQRLLVY